MLEPEGKIAELLAAAAAGGSVSVTGLRKYARWAVFCMSEKR